MSHGMPVCHTTGYHVAPDDMSRLYRIRRRTRRVYTAKCCTAKCLTYKAKCWRHSEMPCILAITGARRAGRRQWRHGNHTGVLDSQHIGRNVCLLSCGVLGLVVSIVFLLPVSGVGWLFAIRKQRMPENDNQGQESMRGHACRFPYSGIWNVSARLAGDVLVRKAWFRQQPHLCVFRVFFLQLSVSEKRRAFAFPHSQKCLLATSAQALGKWTRFLRA